MAWRSVTQHEKCEVCGCADWCSIADDGSACICRRVEDPSKHPIHRVDTVGSHYWLYIKDPQAPRSAVADDQQVKHKYEVADAATLDRVYRQLLMQLPALEPGHVIELRHRGYSMTELTPMLFRSWPRSKDKLRAITKELVKVFGKDTMLSVPGYAAREYDVNYCVKCKSVECKREPTCELERSKGHIVVAAWPEFSGYVIPIRDLHGRIVALQLRSDEDNPRQRYVTFSSRSTDSCGANLSVHVPDEKTFANCPVDVQASDEPKGERPELAGSISAVADPAVGVAGAPPGSVEDVGKSPATPSPEASIPEQPKPKLEPVEVWVTEGVHKAEISCRHLVRRVIGMPSVSAIGLALPVLEELSAERVVLALDADTRTKPAVAGALKWAANTLSEQGFDLAIATWPSDAGKGLDDVLNAGEQKDVIQVLRDKAAWTCVAEAIRTAGLESDPVLDARLLVWDLDKRVEQDPSYASRKTIIDACARLVRHGTEGERFLAKMKTALPGRYTAWRKEVERAEHTQEKKERIHRAKTNGKVVLQRGDHAELAELVVEQLATDHDYWDSNKKARLARKIKPIHADGRLYVYSRDSGIWSEHLDSALSTRIQALAGASINGEGELKVFGGTVQGTAACVQAICSFPKYFDTLPSGVAFPNAFLKATDTGLVWTTHSPDHRARYCYDFNYSDICPEPKRFLALLERALDGDEDKNEKIALIQEFIGACHLGLATKFQKALLFYGPAGNDGKTTIAACLVGSMPPGSVSHVRPEQFGERFKLASLSGALINYVDELGKKPVGCVEILKEAITAKMAMEAEKKGKDPFQFRPIAGYLWASNYFLMSDDQSGGFFRRFEAVGFNRPIPDGEVVVGIEDEILATERVQIVHWALTGAHRLLKNGHYTIPSSSQLLKDEWRKNVDAAYCFVTEELEETDDSKKYSKIDDLYYDFVKWADDTGRQRMSRNNFGHRLKSWRARSSEGNSYRLQRKEAARMQRREAINQKKAEEALAAMEPLGGSNLVIDSEEERRTDLAAMQLAAKLCELN